MFTDTPPQHGVSILALKALLSPAAVLPPQKKEPLTVQPSRAVADPAPPAFFTLYIRLNTWGAIVDVLPGGDSVPLRRWGLKSGAVTCQTAGMLMPWLP